MQIFESQKNMQLYECFQHGPPAPTESAHCCVEITDYKGFAKATFIAIYIYGIYIYIYMDVIWM